MGSRLRRRHEKTDVVSEESEGTLSCTCGWGYSPDPGMAEGVAVRHAREADIPL